MLDVATGLGEAAQTAVATVGDSGLVIGADISSAMLAAAYARLSDGPFRAVVMDGESLAFRDASFDVVLCHLGLMFFPDPSRGLAEFRRVLRPGRCAAACVISSCDRAPMWGMLAETLSRFLPGQATTIHLSFSLADASRLEAMFRYRHTLFLSLARFVNSFLSRNIFEQSYEPIYHLSGNRSRFIGRCSLRGPLSAEADKIALPRTGMPAEVFITTGRGTVALYALRPLLDSFNSAFRED